MRREKQSFKMADYQSLNNVDGLNNRLKVNETQNYQSQRMSLYVKVE